MATSKPELVAKAESLGIELNGTEVIADLEKLIADKEANPGSPIPPKKDDDELTEEELAKQQKDAKDEIDRKMKEKKDKKEKGDEDRMYTRSETEDLIEKAIAKFATNFKKELNDEDIIDPDKPQRHDVAIARMKEKFIVGFKNMNTDPYLPDVVVHSVNLTRLDKNTGKSVTEPWVTVIYKDKKENGDLDTEEFPLDYVVKKSTKVACELVERKKFDASTDFGLIEETEVKEYARIGRGTYIKAKVSQWKEVFVVKDPKTEELFEVQPDVVNWSQVKQIYK